MRADLSATGRETRDQRNLIDSASARMEQTEMQGQEGADILIVEDNDTNMAVLRIMLKKIGQVPREARDGCEGVDMALRERPRLILMDLSMPRKDGITAAREIFDALGGDAPPIVAVTASVTAEQQKTCMDAGFSEVLPKPLQFGALSAVLQRYLG